MGKYKIVFADYYYPDNEQEVKILEKLGDVEILDLTRIEKGGIKDPDKLMPYISDADAVIVQFAQMSKAVIDSMQKCKIIARYAIGVDNIDLKACAEKGIVVSNVPDYCIEEVSDTAVAHILNCLRSVSRANNLIHEDRWSYEAIKPLKRIAETPVGLVAFGNIARRTAEKLRPWGMPIYAADPFFKDQAKYDWVTFVELDELFKVAEVLSVHAPLSESTRHLINGEAFAKMKDGVCIVNTSRGGLIDEGALVSAISSGKVRAAGLDVLDMMDSDYNRSELLKFSEQITITPHLGWYSESSVKELQRKVAENVFSMLQNGKPNYRVR